MACDAVLALAGAVAHWQKSSSLASVQLLLGGIALGLCLLAVQPIALMTVINPGALHVNCRSRFDDFAAFRCAEIPHRVDIVVIC